MRLTLPNAYAAISKIQVELDKTSAVIAQLSVDDLEVKLSPSAIWSLISQIPERFYDDELLSRTSVMSSFLTQYFPDCTLSRIDCGRFHFQWQNVQFVIPSAIHVHRFESMIIVAVNYMSCDKLLAPPQPAAPSEQEKMTKGYVKILRDGAGILPRMRFRMGMFPGSKQVRSAFPLYVLYWFQVRQRDKQVGRDKLAYWEEKSHGFETQRKASDEKAYRNWKENVHQLQAFKRDVYPRLEALGLKIVDGVYQPPRDLCAVLDQIDHVGM